MMPLRERQRIVNNPGARTCGDSGIHRFLNRCAVIGLAVAFWSVAIGQKGADSIASIARSVSPIFFGDRSADDCSARNYHVNSPPDLDNFHVPNSLARARIIIEIADNLLARAQPVTLRSLIEESLAASLNQPHHFSWQRT